LILFNRTFLSEQCFWTLNNFLLGDRQFTPLLLSLGICKAIQSTLDKIKTKSAELLAEMFYTVHYLLDFDEVCVIEVYKQIPNLVKKITAELEFDGERLL
jgi:hypothetical protein